VFTSPTHDKQDSFALCVSVVRKVITIILKLTVMAVGEKLYDVIIIRRKCFS